MNKNILVLYLAAILGIFIYVQSKNEKEIEKKEIEPVASFAATKKLLENLDHQLVSLQKKISEHSEKLAGVFAKWKREGRIQYTEQWNQTKDNIQKLASELKIMANNRDLVEELRRNKELFDIFVSLNKESQEKISNIQGTIPQIMSLSSLYGKSIATDKVLEKINMLKPAEKTREYLEAAPSQVPKEHTYDTLSVEDYGFEEEDTFEESPTFDEFGLEADYDFDYFSF